MKKALKWIGIILAVFIVIGIIASSGDKTTDPTPSGDQTKTEQKDSKQKDTKPKLELLESSLTEGEFGNRYVVGTVQNNSNKTYTYVQVEINLYDDDEALIGSTLDNVNNLEPGGKWKFKAMVLEDEATSYKIKEITGH